MIESPGRRVTSAISLATIAIYLRLTRPQQWVKNAVVLAGLVFAEVTDQPRAVLDSVIALVAFVIASGAIYVFNDLRDAEVDRLHPRKQTRPIASGQLTQQAASTFGVALAAISLILAAFVTLPLAMIIAAFMVMMACYTLWLKRVPILDVTVIAVGFVLRAVGGAVAVSVPISPWLFVCTFLLALFLGFGKRRAELIELGEDAANHRSALEGYNATLLDQLVAITAVSALVTYSIYTVVSSAVPEDGSMIFSIPLVAFAIFRYLWLIYARGLGGSPESLLFRDRYLLTSVVVWGLLALVIMERGS